MINLHESMRPGRDRTRDPWNCSQTRICSQTRYMYRLRYAARSCVKVLGFFIVNNPALQRRFSQNIKIAYWVIVYAFCRLLIFFQNHSFFKKIFQECDQYVKQFGSRSGPMLSDLICSKLFAKFISRRH